MSVSLRPMRWWDVEALIDVERALFGIDAWSAEVFWSELAGVPDTRWYLVAETVEEVGAMLVGYTGLAVSGVPGDGLDGDLQTIAVRPDRRGHGLGARLLEALLTEADRRGCDRVLLEVRRDNAAARSLYRRNGFRRIAERPRYYSDGTDALVLRRDRR